MLAGPYDGSHTACPPGVDPAEFRLAVLGDTYEKSRTHLRRVFDLAALYQVRTGSHGATDLSPVCLAAALHVDIAVPNFGIQEYMPHTEATDKVFPHTYRFADGLLYPSEEPGLGVDIDEDAAAAYPYRPAYLPVNRLGRAERGRRVVRGMLVRRRYTLAGTVVPGG